MKPVLYSLIRSNRTTITIRVLPDGSVEVRAPLRTPRVYLDELVLEKAAWIQSKSSEAKEGAAMYPPHRFAEGERFMLLGKPRYLCCSGRVTQPCVEEDRLLAPAVGPEGIRAVLEQWYKEVARSFFTERLDYYAPLCGVSYHSLRLSGAKGRWGSCNRDGGINLTWRLIMAPVDVIDYVAVHELCHIREPNHQKAFWRCVEALMPDYKEKRAWLRAHQQELYF